MRLFSGNIEWPPKTSCKVSDVWLSLVTSLVTLNWLCWRELFGKFLWITGNGEG